MTQVSPRRIIIDTDPGQDDAVAILLALASPELQVEAIMTVAGNVSLAQTTKNACALLELAGREDVPVLPVPHGLFIRRRSVRNTCMVKPEWGALTCQPLVSVSSRWTPLPI